MSRAVAGTRPGILARAAHVFGRYKLGARWYDVLSGERPVYRTPRLAGLAELRLRPGDRVLDLGCGTGLNFGVLHDAVGVAGTIIGVDASAAMLARAKAHAARWPGVRPVAGDVGRLREVLDGHRVATGFDAAVFTYSLSIMDDWRAAFAQTLAALRPGGRVVVVDLAMPRGRHLGWWPLARLACWTGGVDPYRAPWRLVAQHCVDVSSQTRRGGHVRIVAGTIPATGAGR